MTSELMLAYNWLTAKGDLVQVNRQKNASSFEPLSEESPQESNLLLLPGMVDLHAIVQPLDATIDEAKAAYAHGITSLLAMPRHDKDHQLGFYATHTQPRKDHARVYQSVPLSNSCGDTRIPLDYNALDNSKVKALVITDEDLLHTKALLRCLQLAKTSGIKVFLQPNWAPLCQQAQVHTGQLSVRKGLTSIGASAETIALQLVLELIRDTGASLHCTGVTSARSVAIIAKAKKEGLDVSADVSISHLLFTDQDIGNFDTHYKLWPPLRSEEDKQALLGAVNIGTIDAISSLHTPDSQSSKHLPFASAAYGAATFDTFIPMLVQLLNAKKITPERIAYCCCTRPAQILGIDNPDSIMIDTSSTLGDDDWHSAGKNSPWFGQPRLGRTVKLTRD